MSDATRAEAVRWARENHCDFRFPTFPSPAGWMWVGQQGELLELHPLFTNTDDKPITLSDVLVITGGDQPR